MAVDWHARVDYKENMKTTVNIFKSLADETRLRLLLLLQGQPELCVCDLMHALDMPQSTVSRHLAYLKKHGWLQDRRGGVWMYYTLNKKLASLLQAQLVLVIATLNNDPLCRADQNRLIAYQRTKERSSCA